MRTGIKGGQLRILSKDQVSDMHLAVLDLLNDHGMRIEEENALKLLNEVGSEVDFKEKVVKFPEYLVEEAIRKAPRSVRLAGRVPENDFILEDKKVYFRVCGVAPNIIDLETGLRRESKIADVANGARISDGLPNIDCANEISAANDVPLSVVGLYKQEAMMANTTKHIILAREHSVNVERIRIKMAELVAGGERELRKRPLISMFVEPMSPLFLGREDTQAIMEWAAAGLPLVCVSVLASGGTSPVTLAGTIVQGVAESLAGNVIMQLVNPGTPFIFGLIGEVMDMRTTLLAKGAETMLMCAASAQLAHYYGLPSIGMGGASDSNTLDTQAIAEASMSMTMGAMSGINLIQGIGYLESGLTGSYEMAVICNEIAGMLRRMLKGIHVNDDTLAVETITEAGHGGSFLGLKHTRKHFSSEHLLPELMNRLPIEEWDSKGGKTLKEKAHEKAVSLLKNHFVKPIDEDVRKEIKLTITKAEKSART
ncbi:MAG: trimethylamine methyltransferase family protein [Candidatus Bathyarchaeota archaeon]|nr:MAG: trimethylamine methyltransferase family protein [Candidatus Bathyarchaeota archaeon]